MEYFLGEYIEDSVQHEVLDTATNKAEYRQYRAAIIRNNCLTKFRGWDKGQIGEKSRERVLDSIINEKIFFSTALGRQGICILSAEGRKREGIHRCGAQQAGQQRVIGAAQRQNVFWAELLPHRRDAPPQGHPRAAAHQPHFLR